MAQTLVPWSRPKRPGEGVWLSVDDEVHLALPVQLDILRAVAGDGSEAHRLEQTAERGRVRRRVLDELEAFGANRVVPRRELQGAILSMAAFRLPEENPQNVCAERHRFAAMFALLRRPTQETAKSAHA